MSVFDQATLQSLRADFPILEQELSEGRTLAFLDNGASTPRSRQVIAEMRRVEENDYANVHRGIHTLSERSTDLYEQARERVARFVGAEEASEIIFTSGATMGINLVARSWGDANVREGDEIVVTLMEHHSNLIPWQQLAERTGATIRHIGLTEDGRLDLTRLDDLLTPRTKIVAFASVSNVLGTINPVRELTEAAHQVGAKVLVDAAQSAPHLVTDVRKSDVDFLVFSGHKMTGPSGVGILYGKRDLLTKMPPFLGGGSMINEVAIDRFTAAEIPARFEAGTPPIIPAIGLATAIDYLEEIGLERIAAHEHALVSYAMEQLAPLEGIRLLGPSVSHRTGLISFSLDRPHPHDVAQELDRLGIAVRAGHHCAQPLHEELGIGASTRASFYFYNSLSEIDSLRDGLRAIIAKFAPGGRRRRARVE